MSRTRLIGILIMACLPLMAAKCVIVPIKDGGGRKKQIKNVANSAGQQIFLKKIKKLKSDIEEAHKKMFALQDSIDQALYRSHTVKDLKIAKINTELSDIKGVENNMRSYLPSVYSDPYTQTIENAYVSSDLNKAALDFTSTIIYPGGFLAPLPTDLKELSELESGRKLAQNAFWEFSDQRALQSATIMRKWADIYSEKAVELNGLLLRDKRFSMTDFERISLQREAEKFATLSYEFIEKSDSISLSIKENEFKQKKRAEKALEKYNSLLKYYEK